MKKMNKAIMIIAKIAEVMNWVGAAVMLVGTIIVSCKKLGFLDFLEQINEEPITEMTVSGFSISVLNNTGTYNITALIVFFIVGIISALTMAMIFRNCYLILRTTEGKTWFSKGETPFQPDNIRMVREIGIFSIGLPIIQTLISIIARIIIGVDNVEISVQFTGFVFGLVALCLSQYFSYGAELEADVEGLV